MLNHKTQPLPLIMSPEGSLNQLPVSGELLLTHDPMHGQSDLSGKRLVSRESLIELLHHHNHHRSENLRHFISEFDENDAEDMRILSLYAHRFASVVVSARDGHSWQRGSEFQQALHRYWQEIETLIISGGLTTPPFGQALADVLDKLLPDLEIISSPWGGNTALYGLAHTLQKPKDVLVMDFGATGIKRCVASKYGNQLSMLPELPVGPFKVDGLIRKSSILDVLKLTQGEIGQALPVAISLACYLKDGHPFSYRSGIYHRLADDAEHLHSEIAESWLPSVGLGELLMLEHDSSAAAMAFQTSQPTMMITLGTGLGSAPCPQAGPLKSE